MISTSYANARFNVGVNGEVLMSPRVWQPKPPVIYCHSASMTGGEALGIGQLPDVKSVTSALVAAGYTIAATTCGVLWGNATAQSRIDAALAWLRANTAATDDPAILIGSSMGTTTALSWAAANRSDTSAVIGMISAVDIAAVREANLSLRPSIDSAYGVTHPTPLPEGANPADMDFAGLPIQLWTSSDDDVSVNATSVATDHRNLGALSHTSTAVAAVDTQEILDFIS